ncbi:MAG: outer membrane lipoprotein carrier protein LolA [Treponema sp.]|jgi:hypothetical protein|nr:outer membrane lipoprotein carrier protein LolA [Treponema sp.]
MKTAAVFLLLFAVSFSVFGDDVFRCPLTGETRPRFLSVCGELSKHPVVRGEFDLQKTIKKINRVLDSSGNFIISAEYGIVWDTKKPFPSTMTVGRDFVIQSTPNGTRAVLSAEGNETFVRLAAVIQAVFTGDPRKLLSGFNVFFAVSDGNWEIGLIPRDRSMQNFIGRITMNGSGGNIKKVILLQRNEDMVVYTFSNHGFAAGLSPAEEELFSAD